MVAWLEIYIPSQSSYNEHVLIQKELYWKCAVFNILRQIMTYLEDVEDASQKEKAMLVKVSEREGNVELSDSHFHNFFLCFLFL